MPEMMPLSSTNIDSAGYDDVARELHIIFKSGKTYIYENVGRETFDDLVNASSPGGYLARWVKGTHTYREA